MDLNIQLFSKLKSKLLYVKYFFANVVSKIHKSSCLNIYSLQAPSA